MRCVWVVFVVVTALWISTLGTAARPTGTFSGPGAEKARNAVRQLQRESAIQQISQTTSNDGQVNPSDHFDARNFRRSTLIDNEWCPLKTATRFVWQGTSGNDDGDGPSYRVQFTVTDLTKEIDGIETVVCWDQDFVNDELERTGIVFLAQSDDGTVWHLGQYAEKYDAGEFVAARCCWIHGINDRKAAILMLASPELGTTSFAEKWARTVVWTDRGIVFQVGQETSVPFGAFSDVLVINEPIEDKPGAERLKYYARGVGNVRIDWCGTPTGRKNLELIRVEQLCVGELAKSRSEALKLEASAYQRSKDAFAQTKKSRYSGRDEIELPSIELTK